MATVVHYCQCLLAVFCVGIYPSLVAKKDLFGGSHADIVLLNNVKVRIEAVSFNVLAEDLHVLQDCGEV